MIISVKQVIKFLISVLIPLVVGYLSSFIAQLIAGVDITTYYSQLIKPGFAPPTFIFPIAWTILFILMGISAYRIMKKGYELTKVKDAMLYYWLQLGLNFSWNILFFGLGLRFTALVTLGILLIVVVIMTLKFDRLDKKSAYLNIPYIIWLVYALALNYFIWIINR